MTIQGQMDRISGNIADTYAVLNELGATAQSPSNSDNLARAAASIGAVLYSKAQSLTAAQQAQAKANIGVSEAFLPLAGGTLTGNVLFQNSASAQSGQPNMKWKTVGQNTPYVGFATDQTDGTFVLGSLRGTNYASGLAIGGGSTNLLWKGAKVATADDLSSKANTASPTFTGTPKAPTAAVGTNTTQIATTAFVQTALASAGGADVEKASGTLSSTGWSSQTDGTYTQTVTVSGVTATNDVIVAPQAASRANYEAMGCKAITQAANSITFQCNTLKSVAVTVDVLIFNL